MEPAPRCSIGDHDQERPLPPAALERAAQIFRAMGDASRLRILDLLKHREMCVTEIVAALGEKFTTVSQRLKLLRNERLIARRREGHHVFYALADRHVVDLIHNALAHAEEHGTAASAQPEGDD
ncbi:MAG: metalloregulator ArsR/SmtB family transcription factor [Gemmataceae bacterium]|nr:metalloregulator ArsR/SmtB family transcription factor [Gemmataceae bacterium]MDW8263989.1 metalloregulator ArsR/SmtB family transcription factor [Gemmataceae bacterium]